MWSAKCTYLTQVGNRYAELTQVNVESIIVRFFGIFFLFFQSSSIWGNLISAAVFSSDKNETIDYSDAAVARAARQCGVNYCPSVESCSEPNVTTVEQPDEADDVSGNFEVSKTQLYIIATVYLVCSFLAALIVASFVDPLTRFGESEERSKK